MFDPDSITERYDGKAITKFDIVPKIPQNYIVNEEGRIVPAFTSKAVDPPWVYVRSDPEKRFSRPDARNAGRWLSNQGRLWS
jgi:hypothetical protein